jgi:hypothetical protein
MSRSPKAAKLLREALSMPASARLDLAAALIESADDDVAPGKVDAAWESEARRRLAELRPGVVKLVPWEDAQKEFFDTE